MRNPNDRAVRRVPPERRTAGVSRGNRTALQSLSRSLQRRKGIPMKTIHKLAIATAFAALAACGNNNSANNATDMNATDLNAGTDMNATDLNATGNADMNATDMNATGNAASGNAAGNSY
jgi:hypothetical protein